MFTSATQRALEMMGLASSGTFDVNKTDLEVSALSAVHRTFDRDSLLALTRFFTPKLVSLATITQHFYTNNPVTQLMTLKFATLIH